MARVSNRRAFVFETRVVVFSAKNVQPLTENGQDFPSIAVGLARVRVNKTFVVELERQQARRDRRASRRAMFLTRSRAADERSRLSPPASAC